MTMPVINEFVFNHTGTDTNEYVEFLGDPNTDYSNFWLLQIEGDASSSLGRINSVFQLGTTDANGFLSTGFLNSVLQNGTSTLLLVEDFTGAQGDDVDIDDDGTIDSSLWTSIVDSVAVNDGGTGDATYSDAELTAGFDGGQFTPGGASRIPDGTDTDSASDWVRNDFDLAGIDGFPGSLDENEAVNTPGSANTTEIDTSDIDAPFVPIYDIQGASHRSAFEGQAVRTSGVITAIDSNGFYLQDIIGDNDSATSDGIFVATGALDDLSVGQGVLVVGTVLEFQPGNRPNDLSVTQLAAVEIVVAVDDLDLPDAVVIGQGGRMPPTEVVEDDNFGSFDPDTDGIDFYESLEGMRVTIQDAQAMSPTNRFGETWAVADQGANATGITSRGGIQLTEGDNNPEKTQIQLDSGILPGFSPAMNVGDDLGDVTGVVDYSFGNFEVKPTEEFTVTPGAPARETTDLVGSEDQLTVASYNVFNLETDPTDGSDDVGNGQFDRLADQIVNNLQTPDIIALQEIQDGNGTNPGGDLSGTATLQALVTAIADAGGPTYAFVEIAPAFENQQGGQPGGNIRNAYLYNADRVSLVDGSLTALTAQELSDAGVSVPGAFEDDGTRIPLLATWEFNGNEVTTINNHFSSKFGSTPVYGSVQPFVDAGLDARKDQALAINEYVSSLLNDDADAKIVVLGDHNDFEFAEPQALIESGTDETPELFDQISTIDQLDGRYTFNFEGNSQVLDHLLVTGSLVDKTEIDIVHVNTDFGDAASSDPARVNGAASDHEPILARLTLEAPLPPAPQPTNEIQLSKIGSFQGEGAEIVAHDEGLQRLYVTNGEEDVIDVIDIQDPENPVLLSQIPVGLTGGPNSVDVFDGIVAVALEDNTVTENGLVAFFNSDGDLVQTVEVGALPDMVTFTPDGSKLLVANEGEPDDGVDPKSSVSILDLSQGLDDIDVTTADFTAFDGREAEFRAKGVRLFPDVPISQDLEPENIAVAPDGKTAMVTLQEANALALLDLEEGVFKDIIPLGVKDHSKGQPILQQFDITSALPTLGTTENGQEIKLGGLSGLTYVTTEDDGKLVFATVPDRGPNADQVDVDNDGNVERPLALPDYQARVEFFAVDPETGEAEFRDPIMLTRFDGVGNQVPITGRPNKDGDEEPVDLNGNPLELDPFGADMEGIVFEQDGSFWTVDEYRPAIYHFNSDGVLINRFIAEGTAADVGMPANTFGTESLPEEYAERRANRGFEAVALDEEAGIVYAFIQTPLANPDRATSDNSDVIRILGIDMDSGEPVSEYVYLLEGSDIAHSKVDKIGDAVFTGDGTFQVIERDSSVDPTGKKFIFEIDITHATNLLADDAPALPEGRTLESLSADELSDLGIDAVNKIKVLNLPSIGYLAGDKPEGLTLLPDGRLAVINDNDFSLTGDIDTDAGTVGLTDETLPVVLGLIDFDDGNLLDASDRDGAINLQNYPVFGMYMPDGIAAYESEGQTYFITGNEGDARSEDERVADLDLDPDAFPNADALQQDEVLGRLEVSTIDGDLDGDGDYDQLFVYGARSFSIWDDKGNLVFDSGDDFARIVAEQIPELFNANDDEEGDSFDARSDAKGIEPEGVTVGEIDGETYAFIGLERTGGVMVYNVTDPANSEFVQYVNMRNAGGSEASGMVQDVAPEGLAFISAEDSPNGEPLLVVANEASATTSIWEIDLPPKEPDFTLQILHASDLEGGVNAIDAAPNFAAMVDALEETYENTIILSAGDNYLPGPFLNAASDRVFRDDGIFNDVYNELFGLPGDLMDAYAGLREGGGRVDISIMNVIGFDASAVGNHEFDLGSDAFENIIEEDFRDPGLGDDRWVGAQFPYLSANLDFSGDGDLNNLFTSDILPNTAFATGPKESLAGDSSIPKIAPATTIEENGERIGVVGATTQVLESISSPSGTTVIGPNENDMPALAQILQPTIDALVADGVNKIVLVSHLQQIALEQELATLLRGVDVIIAGGSGTLLADAEDVERGLQPGDMPDADYPFTTTNADGDPVVVVSTGEEYAYVGRLVVDFDEDGVIILDEDGNATDEDISGSFATTDAAVAALWGEDDPFADGTKGDLVEELVSEVSGIVQAQDGNIFGSTDVYLDGRRSEVRTEETNFGNLTADANLAVAQAFDASVEVSIKNGGGMRAPIGETSPQGDLLPPQANPAAGKEIGDISQLDISNSLRFNNGLTLITLTSEQLLEVIEHAVSATAPGATPGQFGQFGGISFSFDPSQPAGSRVISAALIDENGDPTEALVENGAVVDPGRTIRVVTLDFIAGGGDNYPFAGFVDADAGFANRVDLEGQGLPDGIATFAPAGSEQDALAEFLAANFTDTAFNVAETDPENDTRIQNLSVRTDTVLDGLDMAESAQAQQLTAAVEVPAPDNADDGDGDMAETSQDDKMVGTNGHDVMHGDAGRDFIQGGRGDDTLVGGTEGDHLMGGRGDDSLFGDEGDDMLNGGNGEDVLFGGLGDDTLRAGLGDDTLNGDAGADILLGGKGDDVLNGGLGNDVLKGGTGEDILNGGAGNDWLSGGDNADIFSFEPGSGQDIIRDFEPGEDLITLSGFSGLDAAGLINDAQQVGSRTVLTLNDTGDTITLLGFDKDDLSEGDIAIL